MVLPRSPENFNLTHGQRTYSVDASDFKDGTFAHPAEVGQARHFLKFWLKVGCGLSQENELLRKDWIHSIPLH